MECVGSPVFGQDGNVIGAISVSSLYKPTEDYDALGRLVTEKAVQLSRLLGFLANFRRGDEKIHFYLFCC